MSSVTAVFAVTGAYYLVRSVAAFSWVDRVNNATHVLMSAVMFAMPWWVPPALAQISVFAAAALWYVYLIRFRSSDIATPLLGHHGGSVLLLWFHALMMSSMVWMVVATRSAAPAAPGMPVASEGMSMTGSAGWAIPASVIIGLLFAAAVVWFVVLFVARAAAGAKGRFERVGLLDAAGSTLMAAGMAVTFLVLMT